jgi:hypothetical protein
MKYVVSVPWSDEERARLRQMWANGMGPTLIGKMLGRSKYSVTKQTQALKLPRHRLPPGLAPTPEPRQRPPQPLRPGARTLPPLPSELTAENLSSHG